MSASVPEDASVGLGSLDALPPSTAVADVLALKGISGCLSPPLRPFSVSGPRVVGPATTVRMAPGPPPGGGAFEPLYELLDTDLSGAVIVVGGAEDIDGAVWGQILSRAARRAGLRAAIVVGAVRDREALAGEGVRVWGCREMTVGAVGLAHVAEVGGPVFVGTVEVRPGDDIVIDASGVVAVPAHLARETLEEALAYAEAERALLRDLSAGVPLAEAYDHKRRVVAAIKERASVGRGGG